MADRFWVGNSGSTDDTAHWSTTSGGPSGASVPNQSNRHNAIFDANSFTLSGQTVTLNFSTPGTIFTCGGMDWRNVTNAPIFLSGTATTLDIGSSLYFSSNMSVNISGSIILDSNISVNNDFDTGGNNIPNVTGFTWLGNMLNFISNVSMPLASFNLSNPVTTNNVSFNISSLSFGNTDGTYYLGTSIFNLNGPNLITLGLGPSYFLLVSTAAGSNNLVFSGTPTFNCKYNGMYSLGIYTKNTATITGAFYNLNINNGLVGIENLGSVVRDFTVTNNLSIYPGVSITFNSPYGGFSGPINMTVNNRLTANGSLANLITLRSIGGISTFSASSVSVSYIDVQNNNASGSGIPFIDCPGGINSGNNTNWVFSCNKYLQNVFLVGAETTGDVQAINSGKSDNSAPIYYELETQPLSFGNRSHLKKISDQIVVFTKDGEDSSLQAKMDNGDYKDISIDLSDRVNIGEDINLEGKEISFKWYGEADESSPVFEGLNLENIDDKGMTNA